VPWLFCFVRFGSDLFYACTLQKERIIEQDLEQGEFTERECEIDSVTACRKATDGKPEFCVHWAGGKRAWGNDATTWESIPQGTVLAVWEKLAAREATSIELEGATGSERAALQNQIAALPQAGGSGIVDRWISATIRNNRSKAQVVEYLGPPSHKFKIKFEEFKQGQSDPDDGQYDLLAAEIRWEFTSAPPSACPIQSIEERVARRNRQ
jgi:hypothetical protein